MAPALRTTDHDLAFGDIPGRAPITATAPESSARRGVRDERPARRQRPGRARGQTARVDELAEAAPALVAMAHRIVWCSVATVDRAGQPRSRVLHPYWEWDGEDLVGWVGTRPTPLKRAHLEGSPYASASYWAPDQDACTAECRASWAFDDDRRRRVWSLFAGAPEPLGYDPATVPGWSGPTSPTFAVCRRHVNTDPSSAPEP